MKTLANLDEGKNSFSLAEKNFEARQSERENRIATVKEEMDKWRQSEKMKVVLSRKYR